MGAAYSQDLRDRIIAARDRGLPSKQVADLFRVSCSWVRRVMQRKRECGETGPRPRGGVTIVKIDLTPADPGKRFGERCSRLLNKITPSDPARRGRAGGCGRFCRNDVYAFGGLQFPGDLRLARNTTIVSSLASTFVALLLGMFQQKSIVELFGAINGLFAGSILGIILLRIVFRRPDARAAIIGIITGTLVSVANTCR